ncbi:MAG: cyclic peptide export ABC transporter [Myxococcales bacterium]|jgi:putative ATP-binding cassette transporter
MSELISLGRFAARRAGSVVLVLAGLGAVSAGVNAGLIATVHRALSAEAEARRGLAWAFVGLALGRVLVALLAGMLMHRHAQRAIAALRQQLVAGLLSTPYRELQRVGPARVLAALTQDVSTLGAALQALPGAVVQAAVLLGAVGYLLWLGPGAAVVLLLVALPGLGLYRVMARRAVERLEQHRRDLDALHRHFRTLTEGARELRMHAGRREAFLREAVVPTTEAMLRSELSAQDRYLLGQSANGLLVLVMIGVALFALPEGMGVREEALSGYVLTGLYLVAPLSGLLRLLPLIGVTRIALRRIASLGVRLAAPDASAPTVIPTPPAMGKIRLSDVTMGYGEGGGGFRLGPVSLSLRPGEVVFVTGENGSGKTTLGSLLCGLYAPDAGEVSVGGRPVDDAGREGYRQLWSAVFAGAHVFERFHGMSDAAHTDRARELLGRLGLSGLVDVADGQLDRVELSSGQRKRLALLMALLEDRPACLFDEWAAEQDAELRRRFYRELIPELAARGKAIVVITHDERYFDAADRVLHMRDGRIEPVRQ